MRNQTKYLVIYLCVLCFLVGSALNLAQAETQHTNTQNQEQPEPLSQAQLDQMLAPIALYPDTLLSHLFVASTYPLEVIQAARWRKNNQDLDEQEALNATDNKDWDPSIKALVPFHDLLQKLNADLAWLQSLGSAFLFEQERVLNTVQNLRQKAYAKGNLKDNEYHQVELEDDRIIISSHTTEERIPFSIWNGHIQISRGILWGSIQIFAHINDNVQQSWLVQGLPWPECQQYANQMVAAYQQWYQEQYRKLVGYLPHWQDELVRLQHLPSFLPNSQLQQWLDTVSDDLSAMHVTIDDLVKRSPQAIEKVAEWYNAPAQHIDERNHLWLETERRNWEVLFAQIESSPLNLSQQRAVLLNDDHNLVLAGAGSGKTSVLIARVAYLLQSHLAKPEEILLLAFGRDAAREMSERVAAKVGLSADGVKISTFHQLGLQILNQVENDQTTISPLALDEKLKEAWCTDWLKKHWMTPTNFKRWQKHLASWPVAYIKGDDELGSHVENPQLIAWLMSQIEQLSQFGFTNTRWPKEQERPKRAIFILKPCPRAAHRTTDGRNRLALADDAAAKLLLHP